MCSGSEDYTIRIWSTVGYECVRILTGHKDGVCSVSFSGDDKKILSGSHDKYFIIIIGFSAFGELTRENAT